MKVAGDPPPVVALEAAAEELYGLPIGQFVARRNELAAQARAAGDGALSAQIKGLRRPTVVGWLVNQLVREHPEEVQPLLALGSALREATAGLQGQTLRDLAHQQRQVLAALVAQARQLAAAAGLPVSDDAARGVADTLQAALADPEAAAQVAAGRLTGGLAPPGFGGLASAPSTVPSPPDDVPAAVAPDPAAQARTDLAIAHAEAEQARTARQRAAATVEQADGQAQRATHRLADLREQLDAATRSQAEAARAARDAHAALDQADRDVRDAARRLHQAQARLDAQARQRATDATGP
ncbi:MAG TPA: hypothetical protein VF143_00870 [Candidatus Nanopelagicales bacterium]